jgi:hypothetical protein
VSGRKSEDDIRKYLPDLDAVLRTADPEAAKERRRQALAELKGEHGEEVDEAAIPPSAGASPWANAGAAEIDRSALPSALAPGVVPPVTTPIKKEGTDDRRRGGAFPGWLKGVAAVLGVLGPLVVLLLLQNLPSSKTNDRGDGTSAALTSTGAGAVSAAAPVKSAVGAASSPEVGLPAVLVVPPEVSSAVVPVAPPAATTAASGEPSPVKPKIKSNDPHDAAPQPNPPKTSAPSAPDVPTARPPAEPEVPPVKTADPPPAESTGQRGLPYRKKDQ